MKRKGIQLKLWRKQLAPSVPKENKSGTITKKIKIKKNKKIKQNESIEPQWSFTTATHCYGKNLSPRWF